MPKGKCVLVGWTPFSLPWHRGYGGGWRGAEYVCMYVYACGDDVWGMGEMRKILWMVVVCCV